MHSLYLGYGTHAFEMINMHKDHEKQSDIACHQPNITWILLAICISLFTFKLIYELYRMYRQYRFGPLTIVFLEITNLKKSYLLEISRVNINPSLIHVLRSQELGTVMVLGHFWNKRIYFESKDLQIKSLVTGEPYEIKQCIPVNFITGNNIKRLLQKPCFLRIIFKNNNLMFHIKACDPTCDKCTFTNQSEQ